jgi:hypothetical protein
LFCICDRWPEVQIYVLNAGTPSPDAWPGKEMPPMHPRGCSFSHPWKVLVINSQPTQRSLRCPPCRPPFPSRFVFTSSLSFFFHLRTCSALLCTGEAPSHDTFSAPFSPRNQNRSLYGGGVSSTPQPQREESMFPDLSHMSMSPPAWRCTPYLYA